MVSPALEQELRRQLETLSPARQRQVLDYARTLSGTPDLDAAYRQMARDERREAEALEWAEATAADVAEETGRAEAGRA